MAIAEKIANKNQENFFNKLSDINLVLSAKKIMNKEEDIDAWAINVHGKFALVDIDWREKFPDKKLKFKKETLLARKEDKWPLPKNNEPAVHLHVDWDMVKWARCKNIGILTKIGADGRISFHTDDDKQVDPLFVFYGSYKEIVNLFSNGKPEYIGD